MNTLKKIYMEIQKNRWSMIAFYASAIIVGLSALKVLGVMMVALLALLTTSSTFVVALIVVAYLIYRGGRSTWQDQQGGENE